MTADALALNVHELPPLPPKWSSPGLDKAKLDAAAAGFAQARLAHRMIVLPADWTDEMVDQARCLLNLDNSHHADDELSDLAIIARLADARRAAGLTQRDVAKRMGTTQSMISEIETGKVMPHLDTVVRYATAVGAQIVITIGKVRWACATTEADQ